MHLSKEAIKSEFLIRLSSEFSPSSTDTLLGVSCHSFDDIRFLTCIEELQEATLSSITVLKPEQFVEILTKTSCAVSENIDKKFNERKEIRELIMKPLRVIEEQMEAFFQNAVQDILPAYSIHDFVEEYLDGVYNDGEAFKKKMKEVSKWIFNLNFSTKERISSEFVERKMAEFQEKTLLNLNYISFTDSLLMPENFKVSVEKNIPKVFSCKTGICGRGLVSHPKENKIVMFSDHGELKIFDEDEEVEISNGKIEIGGEGEGYAPVDWSTDGALIAAGGKVNKKCFILRQEETVLTEVLSVQTNTGNHFLWRVCWTSPNELICGYNHGDLKLINVPAGKVTIEKTHHVAGGIEVLARCGTIGMGVGDTKGRIYILDYNTLDIVWEKEKLHNDRICMICPNLNSTLIASCSNDMTVKLTQISTKDVVFLTKLGNKLWNMVWYSL